MSGPFSFWRGVIDLWVDNTARERVDSLAHRLWIGPDLVFPDNENLESDLN